MDHVKREHLDTIRQRHSSTLLLVAIEHSSLASHHLVEALSVQRDLIVTMLLLTIRALVLIDVLQVLKLPTEVEDADHPILQWIKRDVASDWIGVEDVGLRHCHQHEVSARMQVVAGLNEVRPLRTKRGELLGSVDV